MRAMVDEDRNFSEVLRQLPTIEPRPGFVDEAFRKATSQTPRTSLFTGLVNRPETWVGVAAGAVLAIAVAFSSTWLERQRTAHEPIDLAMNEIRHIEVLIDSERDLPDTNIKISAVGGIALQGFEDQQQIDWRANLRRGSNLLSLPVVARTSGDGVLLAVVEHAGKRRSVTVNVRVHGQQGIKS
jgi:hypothetical protein